MRLNLARGCLRILMIASALAVWGGDCGMGVSRLPVPCSNPVFSVCLAQAASGDEYYSTHTATYSYKVPPRHPATQRSEKIKSGLEPMVPVAGVDTDPLTLAHVVALLARHHIQAKIGDTLVIAELLVPRRSAEAAMRVIRLDASRRQYGVFLGKGETYTSKPAWKTVLVMSKYAQTIQKYHSWPDIDAALKHPQVRSISKTDPYVGGLRYWKRDYVDTDGKWKVAHIVEVWMGKDLQGPTEIRQVTFEVWHNGRTIFLTGSKTSGGGR